MKGGFKNERLVGIRNFDDLRVRAVRRLDDARAKEPI